MWPLMCDWVLHAWCSAEPCTEAHHCTSGSFSRAVSTGLWRHLWPSWWRYVIGRPLRDRIDQHILLDWRRQRFTDCWKLHQPREYRHVLRVNRDETALICRGANPCWSQNFDSKNNRNPRCTNFTDDWPHVLWSYEYSWRILSFAYAISGIATQRKRSCGAACWSNFCPKRRIKALLCVWRVKTS